jgi:hypothetical protein
VNDVKKVQGFLFTISAMPLVVAFQIPAKAAQKPMTGEALFAKNCAACHGQKGVGGGGYPKPLTGTKALSDLSSYISKSMPPGGKTPPAEASEIAKYMFDAFYSPVAQERIRPPRIALQRLTVKQYRNALADLIGPEHPAISGEPGGVNGNYFKKRAWDNANRLIERKDSAINFDFGTKGPSEAAFDLWNFSIVWTGSIIAPETGVYEFSVQSNQNVQFHINGKDPLIDNRVRSSNETEFKESMFLLGGRNYPFFVEFTKQTAGVNDEEQKKKKPPASAFVRLLWKRPKMAQEVIPPQFLSPSWNQNTYVCETSIPADDRSIGFERGVDISKDWDDATTQAALNAADHVINKLDEFSGTKPKDPTRPAKLKEGAKLFLTKAFRQPLSPEQTQLYLEKPFATSKSPEEALKKVIVLGLKSPRFLYREIGDRKSQFHVASDIAFGLWDSIPDVQLLQAADRGDLLQEEKRRAQIQRLVNDPRTYAKLREFLMSWLKVEEIPDIAKSSKVYPQFDQAVVNDLRTSLDLGLKKAVWSPDGSFKKLLTSKTLFLNGRLSSIYGGRLDAGASFKPVVTTDRAGILTHPYLLSRLAYIESTSPIHRGVLIIRNMMGRILAPPPSAFTPVAASLYPTMTTRERVAMQTKPAACDGCHSKINPLGFTLEKYDAIGKVRLIDNNKPVDSSGSYINSKGEAFKFSDANDLAEYIANSEESQAAFVEKLFQYYTKQPIRAYGKDALPKLVAQFRKDNCNIRNLIVNVMMTATGSNK